MKRFIYALRLMPLLALPFLATAQVGSPAPNFTVTDITGQIHQLYNYLDSGKIVVLDFYYTTCGPCQYYSPQVNLAFHKYGCNTGNVIFMSIDYNDTNAEVLAYDQQFDIEFPSVSGLNGGGNAVVSQYGIQGFPTFYVIDSTKKIIEQIDPPTLQVFDFRFAQHGILPMPCLSKTGETQTVSRIEIYPNPVPDNTLHLKFPVAPEGPMQLSILNSIGQLVFERKIDVWNDGSATLLIDALVKGPYLLKLNSLNSVKVYTGLFIKN